MDVIYGSSLLPDPELSREEVVVFVVLQAVSSLPRHPILEDFMQFIQQFLGSLLVALLQRLETVQKGFLLPGSDLKVFNISFFMHFILARWLLCLSIEILYTQ